MTRQPVAQVEWVRGRTGDRWEVLCTLCGHSRAYASRQVAAVVAHRHDLGEHDTCAATVYAPDPQDCGDVAAGSLRGTPLCGRHFAEWTWAEANQ